MAIRNDSRTGRLKTALSLLVQIVLIVIVSGFVLVERGGTMCDPFFFLPLSSFSAVLVGPILIESFRRNPKQTVIALVRSAVVRSVGVVLIILMLSLVLVNAFFANGRPILPTPEVCIWAIALSIAAAAASAAGLMLFLVRKPLNTVKWSFRLLAVAAFLIYLRLPPAMSIFWYELVSDWGVSWMAFAWVIVLAFMASAVLVLLEKQEARHS